MNTNDGPLDFDVAVGTDGLDRALSEMERRVKGFSQATVNEGKKIDGAFQSIGDAAGDLIGPITLATAAFKFGQLANDALMFENAYGMAMREVQTISKAVQDDIEGISQKIADMAANGPDDAIKLSKAFYQIVSAGYDGEEGLKLLEISSKAAVAGVTDTRTAADGLTTVLNAWGLSVDYANKVADVMFKSVERGKTTFSELASSVAQVAPLAASSNIELEQIFAALQTITKQGTPTAQAMTQIRSSIINMNNVLGDGWAKTMTYQEGLNKVAEKAGGSQTALRTLIPDVEGMSAVLALTGEKAAGAADDLNETAKAAGAMETAYGRMMEEADNKWSIVHNKWTREIREIGLAMKDESGTLANFMDAILSKGADVDPEMSIYGIPDKIKALRLMGGSLVGSYIKGGLMPESAVREQYAQFVKNIQEYAKSGLSDQQSLLTDILGIKDKDERLTKLNEFLISLKKAESELGATVFRNSEQQNAAIKIRAQLWGEVEARAKEAIKAETGTGNNEPLKGRTLKTMLDELKTAQDNLGTGSLQQDIAYLTKISALQQEILSYYNKIREARKVEPGKAINPISGNDVFGGVQTTTKEQIKQEFQGDKLLRQSKARTSEAQKQADLIKEQNDLYIRQSSFYESLTNRLGGASEFLGMMSYAISEFDSDLGASVGKMADLANNAANMVANYAAGNLIGSIASGAGILGNIIGLVTSNKEDSTTMALERVNVLLERQSAILANLSGNNYFELAQKQYEDYGRQIDLNTKKLQESSIFTKDEWTKLQAQFKQWQSDFPNPSITFATWVKNQWSETNSWTPQDFINAYTEGSAALDDQQVAWIQEIVKAQKQRAELLQETFRQALGFDASDVSDAIFQGIEDGLNLGENNLGGFADTFGKLMKKALMQNVTDALNLSITNSFLPEYQKAILDGVLTDEERANLETIYANLVAKAEKDSANIQSITGKYSSSTSSGLSGITASITEETGSLLAGQFMGMRIDLKNLQTVNLSASDDIKSLLGASVNQTTILNESLTQLMGIKKNTDPLSGQLNEIIDNTREANRILNDKL